MKSHEQVFQVSWVFTDKYSVGHLSLIFHCIIFTGKPSKPSGPIKVLDIQRDSATIEWMPPKSDGGIPLKNYIIEMREAKRATWKKVTTVEPNITSYCLQKLVENVDYFFRVFAENKIGISEPLEMDKPITIKSPYGMFLCCLVSQAPIKFFFWFSIKTRIFFMWDSYYISVHSLKQTAIEYH